MLQIRKKLQNVFKHFDTDLGDFLLSKGYFKIDKGIFQIVEDGGARRMLYSLSEITVYDDTESGFPETFLTDVALYNRLFELGYNLIDYNGLNPSTPTVYATESPIDSPFTGSNTFELPLNYILISVFLDVDLRIKAKYIRTPTGIIILDTLVEGNIISIRGFIASGSIAGGSVISVTDDDNGAVSVDNSNPTNPIIRFNGVYVDGTTVTGNGTEENPLASVGGGGGVTINDETPSLTQTYSSEKSEDTFVKRSGTEVGKPMNGTFEIADEFEVGFKQIVQDDSIENVMQFNKDEGIFYQSYLYDNLTDKNIQNRSNISVSPLSTSLQSADEITGYATNFSVQADKVIIQTTDPLSKGFVGTDLYDKQDDINAFAQLGDLTPLENDIFELQMNKANQATTYTKTEVDAKVASVYKIRGSVANFASLPSSGQLEGDVWNLLDNGDNYAWVLNLNNTGVAGWDKLSGSVDLTAYETKVVAESKYLQIVNASATVLSTVLTGISFLTGGAIVSTDSVLVAFGKVQKQINDIGTALGLKQDTLTDTNFGAFTNSVADKNTQSDTDVLAYVDVTTGKWVKQTFSKLVDYLKGFFQTSRIIVTSNITAVNGSVYHNNGNNTFTDPTPENNRGFYVLNVSGSPTIGGNAQSVGTYLFRYYDGTNWINNTIKKGVSNAVYSANKTLTPMDNNDTIFMDSGTLTVNPTAQAYQNGYTIAVASSGGSNTPLVLQSATDWSYVINANASIASGSVFIEKGGTATIVRKANLKIFQINGSVI